MKNVLTMKYLLLLLPLLFTFSGNSQVVINEVYPETDQVEIMNIGNDVINMIGAQINDGMQGNVLLDNSIPTDCGDFVLTPGEITVFEFNMDIAYASGQLLLTNTANTPISFIQWGGIQSLATFAFSSGTWDDPTAFLPSVDNGNSIQLVDQANRFDPSGYLQANPTLCDENTACAITDLLLRALTCDDNGTTDNPTDDFFTFIPFVEGTNIVGNVELTIDEGTLTPSSVPQECNNCVVENSIGTANEADYALTITANDGDCIYIEAFTAPESCSPDCSIATHQVLNVTCNDNGTPTNPDDDYLEFLLTVWGFNGSESGYFLIFPDGTEQGPFTYMSSHPISSEGLWNAGMGDFPIIMEDADDISCNRTITINDPGSCSDQCSFASATFFSISCDDNGTDLDPSDDFLTFFAEVDGVNLGDEYEISSPQVTITPEIGSTLTISQFSTGPGINDLADIDINFVSIDDEDCRFSDILVNPGGCSNNCILSFETLDITCNNNGTPSDNSDDFYQLDLMVSGTNVNDTYTANIQPFAVDAQILNYNTLYQFSTEPGSADDLVGWGFTFFDTEQQCGGITLNGLFDGPCSNECGFTGVDITNVQCNDNGTDLDPSDDFITFNVEVMGNNLSDTYLINSPDEIEFTPNTGSSLTITPFSTNAGSAGVEEQFYTIPLEDATISSCSTEGILVDPGSCSNNCILDINTLDITCNDNDTPEDNSDDFYQLDLMVSGTNVNDTYTANIQPFEMDAQILNYNTLYQFTTEPGSAEVLVGWGFTFFDTEQQCGGITLNGMFEGPCSDICSFTEVNITDVECNDNGTNDDPSDDFITFNVEVSGNNLSDQYRISSPDGIDILPSIGSPVIITSFSTSGDPDDRPHYNIVLEDLFTPNCGIETTLVNPGTCSENCTLILDFINIRCNNNGTPEDTSDDFYELELLVEGTNTSATYDANIPPFADDTQVLEYGTAHYFATPAGSATSLEEYSVTLSDSERSCTNLTLAGMFEYDCVLTNTLELVDENQIQLYPNPATNMININFVNEAMLMSTVHLSLQNMQSQIVIEQELITPAIDIKNLPAGTYLLTLRGERWLSRQIIIKS